ncbi:MAG: DNA internalization-related competence protein ComEC/Rec2 [endosymbiont of Galathealinum brachiosum]|uniref:DNA internalization-related competence protein ComEC/Rec2 n=1 Tax=endosymbiont of Galathealinum brachiosum TaxID=2200906 RepID=A0A370DGH4_9GAMM|nr:MAG: DNA internalization-related competence protein ComEC/Rec2 [endosymbiont of Galathealinum brachiosum]
MIRILVVSDSRMTQKMPSLPLVAISLLAGVCFLQIQPDLYGPFWTDSVMLIFLPLSLWLFYRLPESRHVLAFQTGYLWALLFAHIYLYQLLPDDLSGQDVLIEGVVVGLPDHTGRSVRFNFNVTKFTLLNATNGGNKKPDLLSALPSRLRLSWYYHKGQIKTGEYWQIQVRLKAPHGMQNLGGFDYEKWLYQQGIQATGYIRKSSLNKRLKKSRVSIDSVRENLSSILSRLPDTEYQGLLQALTIGHKSEISHQQWDVLRKTGTSHLMAISGLHIGLVAGLVFFTVRRFVPAIICKYSSAPQVAALISLIFAGYYALLAGFSVPTQRAFIMLLVIMLALVIKRPAFSLNTLSLALISVLLIDPSSVLSVGFWLSFLAVLVITLVSSSRVVDQHCRIKVWLQGVKIQWLIALAMLPLSLLLFQQGSLISPLVNMFIIPLVGMVIVPLSLLASLISLLSADLSLWLFTQTSELFSVIWHLTEWFADMRVSSVPLSSIPLFHSALALSGVVLLLLPGGFPLRYSGLIMILPMLLYQYPRPDQGAFWVSVLDVGQGLSVVVQTRDKTLLYDTGAKLGERFDLGERVIVPYLNYVDIQTLDLLMVSHGDNDHAGGADSVLRMMNVKRLLAAENVINQKSRISYSDKVCVSGQSWVWNEVSFEVLHPDQAYKKPNNRSCVLKVWNQHYSLLIPGDIERKIELKMLSHNIKKLKADILIMPHHGSNTSSTQRWLDEINPRLAISSAGFNNRFGHPTQKVLKRYQKQGSHVLNTANSGMIQLKLPDTSGDVLELVSQQRKVSTHYWNHRF